MDASRTGRIAEIRALAEDLVRIPSVSPSKGESRVARRLGSYLRVRGAVVLGEGESRLPDGRRNLYALVPGEGPETVILTGHMDTVGIEDYARLAGGRPARDLAHDPARLERILGPRCGRGRYLYGRGAFDMKGGLAAAAWVAAARARLRTRRGNVLVAAVCDEENESAGILAAVRHLRRIADRRGLRYLGAINTDYTAPRHPGDPAHHVYAGSIGKILPSFYVAGLESHAGEPFQGVSANLIAAEILRAAELHPAFCEHHGEETTPPPVALRFGALKEHYDVQTPATAHLYFNHLLFRKAPAHALEEWRRVAERAFARALRGHAGRLRAFAKHAAVAGAPLPHPPRVLSYEELLARARAEKGPVADRLVAQAARRGKGQDLRTASLDAVRALVDLLGPSIRSAVILFLSPPFYPPVRAPADSPLVAALRATAERWSDSGIPVKVHDYYPYISDLSYLSLDRDLLPHLTAVARNTPHWGGLYAIDFEAIGALDVPAVNLGPHGADAHKATERLDLDYSFGEVPAMIADLVERLLGGVPPT